MWKKKLATIVLPASAVLAGICLVPGVARAQDDVTAVFAAHRAFRASWANFDADAVAKMLSEDFVWITRGGAKTDKAAMIAAFRAHRTTLPDHSEQQRVRVYGTIGVVTEMDSGTNPNTKAPANTAITEVWKKQGGAWILILFQGSPVRVQN